MNKSGFQASSLFPTPSSSSWIRRRHGLVYRLGQLAVLLVVTSVLVVIYSKKCSCPDARAPGSLKSKQVDRRHDSALWWRVDDQENAGRDSDIWYLQTQKQNQKEQAHEDNKETEEISRAKAKERLNADAQLIVDAVLKNGNEPMLPSTVMPVCKGYLMDNEVEDILCIHRPRFLKDVKNPCWWDPPVKKGTPDSAIRCLPYFHILGCEKCGTSDLWQRITSHPDTVRIQGTVNKEANWWAWQRYGIYANRSAPIRNFTRYTTFNFKPLDLLVQKSLLNNGLDHTRLITGDGTPSDLFDFRGWQNISQNRGLKVPEVLTPHLMKHFYPNPKFIAILRNPVERLYSDYYFSSHGKNSTGFHQAVLKAIRIIATCIRAKSVRECFFDRKVYASLPVRFHYMFYSVYVREWLKVFPRETFLFFQFEEYQRDPRSTLRTALKFLDLKPLNQTQLDDIELIERFRVGTKKQEAGEMLSSTRKILEAIARPCNDQFGYIMGDPKFAWNDSL